VVAFVMGELPEAGPEPHDLPDIRRLLYGLQAVLQIHCA
jgi:hypothetical protein